MFEQVTALLAIELSRAISGRLFTEEQIRTITKTAIGKYVADFFPQFEDVGSARNRVEDARDHIDRASAILTQMQAELSSQSMQLDKLLIEVEEKKGLAEKYGALATTNKEQFAAYKSEIEELLRTELLAQSEKGRRLRQIISAVMWVVTLVLGAWLGTYFKEAWSWIQGISTL